MSHYKRAATALAAAGLPHIVIRKRFWGPAPEDTRLHRQQSRCFETWQAALHAVLVEGFRPTPLDEHDQPLPILPDPKSMKLQANDILITIDDLARACGSFIEIDANNGYGCSHPENESGHCLRRECPIASLATMADLQRLDFELWISHGGSSMLAEDIPEDEEWMVWNQQVAQQTTTS